MSDAIAQWFKRDVTLGNMVSWLLIVAGFVYGYSQLNSDVRAQSTAIQKLEAKDETLQTQINTMRELMNSQRLEVTAKLARIETILDRIDGKVERALPKGDRL